MGGNLGTNKGRLNFDQKNLFDNHLGNEIWQCPIFLGASKKLRLALCYVVKICTKCFEEYNHSHNISCKIVCDIQAGKAKQEFTCKEGSCMMNVLVCCDHKNTSVLENMQKNYEDKGVIMSFHAQLNGRNLRKKKTGIGPGSSDGCSPGSLQSHHSHHKVDTQKQLEELFEGAKKQGIEVVPEPKGRPIFMFFPVAGTNKPVLTFLYNICCVMFCKEIK